MSGFPMPNQPKRSTFPMPNTVVAPPPYHVNLPPMKAEAAIIDDILKNPALYAELRSRGVLVPQKRALSGQPWIAKQDGQCAKAVGWMIDDAGYLRNRECAQPIARGAKCWRQGYVFYGSGCHPKAIVRMDKVFINTHLMNSDAFAANLPDRRKLLAIMESLWQQDLAGGHLLGEFDWDTKTEDVERKESRELIERRIIDALKTLQRGFELPQKPKVTAPKPSPFKTRKVKPEPKPIVLAEIILSEMTKQEKATKGKDTLIIVPGPKPVGIVTHRFSGPDAERKAKQVVDAFGPARAASKLRPLIACTEGTQWVVINPDAKPLDAAQPVVKGRK